MRPQAALSQVGRNHWSEMVRPAPNRLIRHRHSAFGQQILDVAGGTQGTLGFANGASHLSLTLLGDYNPADFAHQTLANGSTLITYT